MKKCLQDQHITLKDTIVLDPYYSRHDGDGMGPLPALTLIVFGVILGIFTMFAVQKCTPEPAHASGVNSIRCSFCHYERVVTIKTGKQYKAHLKAKKHSRMKFDNENEYLANLIAGGKL